MGLGLGLGLDSYVQPEAHSRASNFLRTRTPPKSRTCQSVMMPFLKSNAVRAPLVAVLSVPSICNPK